MRTLLARSRRATDGTGSSLIQDVVAVNTTVRLDRLGARRALFDETLQASLLTTSGSVACALIDYNVFGATMAVGRALTRRERSEHLIVQIRRGNRTLTTLPAEESENADGGDGRIVSVVFRPDGKDAEQLPMRPDRAPFCRIDHPWRTGHVVSGRVTAFGHRSATLETTDANVDILPGTALHAVFATHEVSIFKATVRITRALTRGDRVLLALAFDSCDRCASRAIGLACLSGAQVSSQSIVDRVKAIRALGYSCRQLADSVRIVRPAYDSSLYRELLTIRLRAYKAAGKVAEHRDAASMADEHDSAPADLIVALVGGEPVATIRVSRPGSNGELPFMRYYDSRALAPKPTARSCEISKFAVLPEFQRTDVAVALMRAAFESCVLRRADLGFLLATPVDARLYRSLGATPIAAGAFHDYVDANLDLYAFSWGNFTRARGCAVARWDQVAAEPLQMAQRFGLLSLSADVRIELMLRRLLASASLKFWKWRRHTP